MAPLWSSVSWKPVAPIRSACICPMWGIALLVIRFMVFVENHCFPMEKIIRFCRQALHAANLGFKHPVTKEKLNFYCDFPPDMQDLFSKLRV